MKNKEKNVYFLIIEIVAILLIVMGIFIILLPKFMNFLYEENVKNIKENFVTETINNDKENYEELYEELQKRNEALYNEKQKDLKDPFSYEQPNINLKNYGLERNIIGFISIPKINVELPILLGANAENMKKGAVHLTETSYPIGGKNTNSVIAAHRGYGKAELFRNIHKLEINDEVNILNFREKITYKVVETRIISPSDIDELLIQEGRDLITLVSCHPYRVNTQRYIVFCERI